MEVAVVNILKVKDTGHTLLQGLAKEQVALGGRVKRIRNQTEGELYLNTVINLPLALQSYI